ncbi:hypothetical protein BJ944DRAFT_124919 [Cunninghamella echinulata]|nr:hypothetical protein BJ944DRAFT_124919 [Cunninghamella echinulata]
MDKILLRLKEEVAMDGYRGTSIKDMWDYIQRFIKENNEMDKDTQPAIDMNYKNFFWPNLRYANELFFFSEDQLPEIEEQKKKNAEAEIDIEPEYHYIENILDQKYEQVYKTYGEKLRIIASKSLQEAQLFIGIPVHQTFSPRQTNLLTSILQAREKGVTQVNLTTMWDLDPRSTGHYVKTLEQKGGIHRVMVNINATRTNLCVHARFKKNEPVVNKDYNMKGSNVNKNGIVFTAKMFEEHALDLLRNAMDNIMSGNDLLSAMGFDPLHRRVKCWFNRSIDKLCDKGLVLKIAARLNDSQLRVRCFQLIHHEEDDSTKSAKYGEQITNSSDNDVSFQELSPLILKPKNENPNTKFLCYVTLERLIMQIIYDAGEKGVSLNEVGNILSCDYKRLLSNRFDKIVSISGDSKYHYGVERGIEFEGRKRLYRYFSYINYVKAYEKKTLNIPDYKPFTFPALKFQLINYLTAEPITGKIKKTSRKTYTKDKKDKKNASKENTSSDNKKNSNDKDSSSQLTSQNNINGTGLTNTSNNIENSNDTNNNTIHDINNLDTSENTYLSSPSSSLSLSTTSSTALITSNSSPKKPLKMASIFMRKRTATEKFPINEPSIIGNDDSLSSTEPPTKRQMTEDSKGIDNMHTTAVALPENDTSSSTTLNTDNNNITNSQVKKRSRENTPTISTTRTKRNCTIAAKNAITSYFKKNITDDVISNKIKNTDHDEYTFTEEDELDDDDDNGDQENTTQFVFMRINDKPTNVTENEKNDNIDKDSTTAANQQMKSNVVSTMTIATNSVKDAHQYENVIQMKTPVVSLPPVTIHQSSSPAATQQSPLPVTIQQPPRTAKGPKMKKETSKNAYLEQRNIYLERRKNIILAVLEEKNIIEYGYDLRDSYEQKRQEMYEEATKTSPKIDLKTLWRTVLVLEKENKLQIYTGNVLLLNGSQIERTIILHNSIDKDGAKIKEYFDFLHEKKVLQPHITKMKTIERTDIVVERLHERLKRMEQSKDEALANNNHLEAKRIENNMNSILANADKSSLTIQSSQKALGNQVLVATQFGFVNSRLIRAKIFHQYLFGLFTKENPDFNSSISSYIDNNNSDHPSTTISSSKIIQNLTIGIICKVVGVFFPDDDFKAFIKNEENYDMKLVDLPDNIRGTVFKSDNKFRYRLRVLFDLLAFLGVVELVNDIETDFDLRPTLNKTIKSPSNLALAYKLHTKTAIHNFRLPDHPVIKEVAIDSPSNIMLYWSDLQYFSTTFDAESGESEQPFIKNSADTIHLRALHTLKNWSTNYVYTNEQREILNKHVDVVNRKTPMNNPVLCKLIAEEIGSTTDIIRAYYRRVQNTMTRQQQKNEDRLRNKISGLKIRRRKPLKPHERDNGALKAISLSTTNPFKVGNQNLSISEKLAKKQNNSLQSTAAYLDDTAPVLNNADIYTKLKGKRTPRIRWTPEDEEILKISYIILKHRSEFGHRFYWKNAQEVLPNYSTSHCMRRISALKDKPDQRELIQQMQVKWRFYYNHGVKNGDLRVWNYVSDKEFRMVDYLSYYIIQEQKSVELGSNILFPVLPFSAEHIKSNYTIKAVENNNVANTFYFEDDFHQALASVSMGMTLTNNSFTSRTYENETYDESLRFTERIYENRILELIITLFKMIIFTPTEVYDPYHTYGLLHDFPDEIFKDAIQLLRDEGLLVRTKGHRVADRRIPGTQFGISDKFMRIMANNIPKNFFPHACEYENYIVKERATTIDPIELNSGMMGCILDLFSDRKISFKIQDMSVLASEKLIPDYDVKRLYGLKTNYNINIELLEERHINTIEMNHIEMRISRLKPLTDERLRAELGGLEALYNSEIKQIIKNIVAYLSDVNNNGATLQETLEHLRLNSKDMVIPDKLFLDCIHIMAYEVTPPIIAFVGFRESYIVLTTHLESWAIFPSQVTAIRERKQINQTPRRIKEIETKKASNGREIDFDLDLDFELEESSTSVAAVATTTKSEEDGINEREKEREKIQILKEEVSIPRIWTDVNGHLTHPVWQGCLQTLLITIMNRPGITLGQLSRIYRLTMTMMEIKQILDVLVDQGLLRKVCIATTLSSSTTSKPKSRLFTKPSLFHTTSSNYSVNQLHQTSYWVLPGYYHHIK